MTREALLAQILDAPDDDAPKLVYADWLEEQGNPAAELIRAQLRGKEVYELAEKHGWFLGEWIDKFERGMVDVVWGPAARYASKKMQAALMPIVTTFGSRKTCVYDKTKKLAGCETLAWTTWLWWKTSGADDGVIGDLAKSPHLARLITLELDELTCTNAGLKKLGRSKHLGRLRKLRLYGSTSNTKYDHRGVLAMIDALPIDDVELAVLHLRVDTGEFGDAPAAAKLVRFDASADKEQAIRVLRGRAMTALRHLRLSVINTPSDDDLEAFLDNPTYAKLERCEIEYPTYEPIGKSTLAKLRARYGDGIKKK